MTGRIVHLGLGNFHRAHQAVYTEDAGDGWTITGVANRSRTIADALREQGEYTVITVADGPPEVRPVRVITEALVAADEPEEVVRRIADPATDIVTLTMTEAGYHLRPGTRDLDPATPATSLLALLARGLTQRTTPITVLSCDNLTANGELLRHVLGQYDPNSLGAAAFPSSMVDRIVPATGPEHVAMAKEAGYADAIPVPAEPFSQWVIEPNFAGPRPAWETAGALLSSEVHAYEMVKVRLLNGCHSLIAYLGLLRGHRYIATAFADEPIAASVAHLMADYAPTLHLPAGFDLARYQEQLAGRFANAALGHRTAQVGTDGSMKLAQRVPDAVAWHHRAGTVPTALALLVAAFLQVSCHPDAIDENQVGRPADPALPRLRSLGRQARTATELAQRILVDEGLFGPKVADATEFVTAVAAQLEELAHR
ncbi:MAG TPA: mannitol dehydrogenase family protein [Pseudonocardiaceae bacterium]|jgi:fructuronate reductase